MGLLSTPESIAQRHAFFAERRRWHNGLPKRRETARDQLGRRHRRGQPWAVALRCFLKRGGFPVTLIETTQTALDRGWQTSQSDRRRRGKGKFRGEGHAARRCVAHAQPRFTSIASCDLIIEAVFEELSVKRPCSEKNSTHANPGAIMANNILWALDLKPSRNSKRLQDVIGRAFFSPAYVMKLFEVVRGAATADDVLPPR